MELEKITLSNRNYRKVLYTGKLQLVLMSLKPGQEIGLETHRKTDQFIRVEKGLARVTIDSKEYRLKSGDAIVIPTGSKHNVINRSITRELKLYTIYTPPEHPPETVQRLKRNPIINV